MTSMGAYPAKLGIIAGGGVLPEKLIQFCEANHIEPFIVAFDGYTDKNILSGRAHIVTRMGAVGTILKTLRVQNVQDLVFIGSVQRPRWLDLRPDFFTARFFARLGFRALGDDGLLQAIRTMLEQEGFFLHGIHDFMQELLMPCGVLGRVIPSDKSMIDIAYGFRVAKALGEMDVGQSVVVGGGIVLGVEGVEGTNELLRRCASYQSASNTAPILVKVCKPQQDKRLDMPTIGPETIKLCAELGYQGIAVEAGSALIVDIDHAVSDADKNQLFVIGITPQDLDEKA